MIFTTSVIPVNAGLGFWWDWWWPTPESYIINNAEFTEWWNEKFKKYKDKFKKELQKTAERWWVTQLKVKLPWWEELKYDKKNNKDSDSSNSAWSKTFNSSSNSNLVVSYSDNLSFVSNSSWQIIITPPKNAPFKGRFEYSYVIEWWSWATKSSWFSKWDTTTWVKVYENMYKQDNKWKTIVFTIKDSAWVKTKFTSKLWW
jgi:hypothetical protein